jgi:predicted RNase H-like HicB family nuclease
MPRNSLKQPANARSTKTYTYTIVIHPADADETGYWVQVPALPGCFTQGETIEECVENARDAIAGYLASLKKDHEPIPLEDPRKLQTVVQRVGVTLVRA